MVKLGELVIEAKNTLETLDNRINNNILSRAATLKPQVISLAKRIQDLLKFVRKILDLLEKNYGEMKPSSTVVVEPLWSISVYGDKLVVTRHKPRVISISYSKSDGAVYIRSKDYAIVVKKGVIQMGRQAIKVELDPGDPEELASKQDDIRYVLKEVMPSIELMNIALEKKFK